MLAVCKAIVGLYVENVSEFFVVVQAVAKNCLTLHTDQIMCSKMKVLYKKRPLETLGALFRTSK